RRHTRSKRDWSSDVCSSDLDLDVEGLGVLPAQLEDVADLDTAGQGQHSLAIRGWVAFPNLGGLNITIRGEVAACDEIGVVTVLLIRSGDPGSALDHTGIGEHAQVVIGERPGADEALDEEWVLLEVLIIRQ